MEIEFLGPLGRVTGSCTWLHDKNNNWNFLVDCGIQQGEGDFESWNQGVEWPFEPKEIKFVLLTHAHMDHCGLIPLLYKKGFRGKVICTEETALIAKTMLTDAVKLGAFYQQEDIDQIDWYQPKKQPLLGGDLHPVDNDLFVNFYRTSHIIGAVAIGVYWGDHRSGNQQKIIFSGDLGVNEEDSEHLPLLRHIMKPHEFDYAVIESTYGGSIRAPIEKTPEFRWQQINQVCDQILEHGSSALMPSFSLGRIQDLMFDLHWVLHTNADKYSEIELILDSPMANKLKPIILEALEQTERTGKSSKKSRPTWFGKQLFRWLELDDTDIKQVDRAIDIVRMSFGEEPKFPEYADQFGNQIAREWTSRVRVITDYKQRQQVSFNQPTIIVASSGSCDGGAVTQWLPNIIRHQHNLVCFTGFAPLNSVAGQLASLQDLDISERRRHRGSVSIESANIEIPYHEIQCEIGAIKGYSGHADQAGLLSWLFWSYNGARKQVAKKIFIQHGNDSERSALKQAICNFDSKSPVEVELPSQQHYKYLL